MTSRLAAGYITCLSSLLSLPSFFPPPHFPSFHLPSQPPQPSQQSSLFIGFLLIHLTNTTMDSSTLMLLQEPQEWRPAHLKAAKVQLTRGVPVTSLVEPHFIPRDGDEGSSESPSCLFIVNLFLLTYVTRLRKPRRGTLPAYQGRQDGPCGRDERNVS